MERQFFLFSFTSTRHALLASGDGPAEATANADRHVVAVERAVLVGGVVPEADLDAAEEAEAVGHAPGEAEADFGADIAVACVVGGAAGTGVPGPYLVEIVVQAVEAKSGSIQMVAFRSRSKSRLRQ
jgi:hypothetical protein